MDSLLFAMGEASNQFIRGLHYLDLKEILCLEDELTLDKAVARAKQFERFKKELQNYKGKSADEVRNRSKSRKSPRSHNNS